MNKVSKANNYEAYVSDKLWMRFNEAEVLDDGEVMDCACCLHIEVENDDQQEAYEMIKHLLFTRCGCCFDGFDDVELCVVDDLKEYRGIRKEFLHILKYRGYRPLWED